MAFASLNNHSEKVPVRTVYFVVHSSFQLPAGAAEYIARRSYKLHERYHHLEPGTVVNVPFYGDANALSLLGDFDGIPYLEI